MTRLVRKIAGEGSFYAAVITLVTFACFPFYWMLITTFTTDGALYNLRSNPSCCNAAPTLEHLRYLFEDTLFVQWLWNTALIGVCVVAITLAVAVPAGYSLARTPGRSGENARIMAQWLSERLGQQFIIENKPGAGNNIGTEAAIHSPPDGYTLLLVNPANAINATLYPKLSFNFIRDSAPVAGIMRVPNVMEVNPSVPAKTVAEFIAYAKANPGKINW